MAEEVQLSEFLIRQARLEDCSTLGRILVATAQDTFRGRVPDQCLHWLTPEESAANWTKLFKSKHRLVEGKFLLVAEKRGQGVLGLALLGNRSDDNDQNSHVLKVFSWELLTLHVDPAWQRQGIGRRLMSG